MRRFATWESLWVVYGRCKGDRRDCADAWDGHQVPAGVLFSAYLLEHFESCTSRSTVSSTLSNGATIFARIGNP